MLEAYRHGPRILRPAVRQGWLESGPRPAGTGRGSEPFIEVSWETASRLVAAELRRTIDTYGNRAIYGGSYGWASAGRFHHAQSQLRRFLNLIGGSVVHRGTYSFGAAQAIMPHIVADMNELVAHHTSWDVIARSTRLFVTFGGLPAKNAQVGVGGVAGHRLRGDLADALAGGCRFVNFSVVRTDLALDPAAYEWIAIRPNTDTAVMLALACEIVRAGRHDRTFLARYCSGFAQWERYLLGLDDGIAKDAAWAGPIAGIDPGRLRALARDMTDRVQGKCTLVNAAWSLQRADHGEQPYWSLVGLAAVIGHIGLPGGGFGVGYGCENALGSSVPQLSSGPRLPTGPNGVPDFIPVARITEMLERPGESFDFDGARLRFPDIRLMYWAGGNPFHHHQDLNRLRAAWQRPETVIVHEQVWNPLAKHADIVLPATATPEREDIGFAYREPLVVAMKQLAAPPGDARDDHAIFAGIAAELGRGLAEKFTAGRTSREWLEAMWTTWRAELAAQDLDVPEFASFWRTGSWHIGLAPRSVVMLEHFRHDPAGAPLSTPSGRIELFSDRIATFGYADCPPHPAWLEPAEWLGGPLAARFGLHLVSDQPHDKLHSQLDFSAHSQRNKVHDREPVWMHPGDAFARGIIAGDVVRIFNDRGACLAGAVLTDAIVPGVVKLSTGAWWDPLEPGVAGALDTHGNPNVLTRDRGTSALGQGCAAQTCLVEIARYDGPLPPVTAYDPPQFVVRVNASSR